MNKNQVKTAKRLLGLLIFLTLVSGFSPIQTAITAQEIAHPAIVPVSVDYDAAAEKLKSDSDLELPPRKFTMTHAIQISAMLSLFLIGYSLWMNGKYGRGWMAVAITFGMLTVIVRMLLSLFVEVTNPNNEPDWDEE